MMTRTGRITRLHPGGLHAPTFQTPMSFSFFFFVRRQCLCLSLFSPKVAMGNMIRTCVTSYFGCDARNSNFARQERRRKKRVKRVFASFVKSARGEDETTSTYIIRDTRIKSPQDLLMRELH